MHVLSTKERDYFYLEMGETKRLDLITKVGVMSADRKG